MLIIIYNYIIITYKKYDCLLLVFAICWYLLHDLHVVYLRRSQDLNFPRPICQRSLWHHQEWSGFLLNWRSHGCQQLQYSSPTTKKSNVAALCHYAAEDVNQMCDTTWYDMIWHDIRHDMSQISQNHSDIVCSSRFICEVYGCSVSVALHAISQELCCRGGVGPSGARAAERAPEAALAAEHNSSKRFLTDWNYLHVHT